MADQLFSERLPVNGGQSLLATITGINLKNTGQTTLITVPTGKTLIMTDVILVPTSVNTIAVAPIIRIGKSASYNEWAPLVTLTGLNASNQYLSVGTFVAGIIRSLFASTEVVKLDVQTGATATSLTCTAYIFGLFI